MKKRIRGMGLVEILIGASIITVGVVALIGSYTVYFKYALANSGNVEAAYLAEEGLEVMTLFRDNGYTANILRLSTTTTYYLSFSGTAWATTTTQQYVDSVFLRKINLTDVRRSLAGAIVSSGGNYDPNTKLVTVTVDYFQGGATTTRSIKTYLGNLNSD